MLGLQHADGVVDDPDDEEPADGAADKGEVQMLEHCFHC